MSAGSTFTTKIIANVPILNASAVIRLVPLLPL